MHLVVRSCRRQGIDPGRRVVSVSMDVGLDFRWPLSQKYRGAVIGCWREMGGEKGAAGSGRPLGGPGRRAGVVPGRVPKISRTGLYCLEPS